ncbi:integrase [Lederbergia citrea]|uniref:Integrase n=1 Tax=Lederbergia citrea TaxID=2833581 RepID=A0A942UT60_9BACI|nr:integrase [Lederbergia citrea]MBS4223504.1 integrase [Lederbergia citrea]
MKKRVKKKQIKKLIQATINSVEMNIEVRHQRTGVNMCYEFIKNYLIFDSKRLPKARMEMYNAVGLEVYIKAITLHELGHFLDREALLSSIPRMIELIKIKRKAPFRERKLNIDLFKADIEIHEMNYVFEESAWTNAEKLNRLYHVIDWECFEKVKFDSLLSYTACYNRDLLIYQQLAAKTNNQIAG